MNVRHAYMNFDPEGDGFVDVGLDTSKLPIGEPEFRTKQEFAEEVDINTIVKRFGLTGEIPDVLSIPVSGDFDVDAVDYKSAMDLLVEAQRAFMSLPADTRSRFANDPARFVAFVSDDKNLDEAIKLGLIADARVKARYEALEKQRADELDAEVAKRLAAAKAAGGS